MIATMIARIDRLGVAFMMPLWGTFVLSVWISCEAGDAFIKLLSSYGVGKPDGLLLIGMSVPVVGVVFLGILCGMLNLLVFICEYVKGLRG